MSATSVAASLALVAGLAGAVQVAVLLVARRILGLALLAVGAALTLRR